MGPVNLVRCYEGRDWGEDWWRELFQGLPVEIIDAPNFDVVRPNSLYVIEGVFGLGHVPADFLRAVDAAAPCGLLHIGDEFLRGPYPVYRHFDFVIRAFPTPFLRSRGVMCVPCGYCNEMPREPLLPASQRPLAWSFTGQSNGTRVEMAKALASVGPNFCKIVDVQRGQVQLSRARFLELLRESAFCPCPMGNVQLETSRLYEALEYGTIPVATRRMGLDYFERLFGAQHRIPVFADWREARGFIEDLLASPGHLDRVQAEVTGWWSETKARLNADVLAFIAQGFSHSYRAELRRDFALRTPRVVQAPRLLDLLSMHDAAAIQGRIARVYRRSVRRFWHLVKGAPEGKQAVNRLLA